MGEVGQPALAGREATAVVVAAAAAAADTSAAAAVLAAGRVWPADRVARGSWRAAPRRRLAAGCCRRAGKRQHLWTFPISAKRYPLATLTRGNLTLARLVDLDDHENAGTCDEPQLDELADAKLHGLGHLRSPLDPEDESRGWIDGVGGIWDYIVRTDALGQQAEEPYWLDRPAVGRFTVSTPLLADAFEPFNQGKPHWRRVRPFNFLLTAHTGALDRGELISRFLLITRYERDPRKWTRLRWINAYEPKRTYSIRVGRERTTPGSTAVVVNSYRDVLADYRVHPEAKSLGPHGEPCNEQTAGLLSRRHVTPIFPLRHRGKEGNRIDEREAGVADATELHTDYREPGVDPLWQLTVHVVRELPVAQAATGAGVSRRTIERAASQPAGQKPVWIAANQRGDKCGHHHRYFTAAVACCRRMERRHRRAYAGRPGYARRQDWTAERARVPVSPEPIGKTARAKLAAYAVAHARAQLRNAGIPRPPDHKALLAVYLEQLDRQATPDPESRLCACGCGQPVPAARRGRPRRYIDETHRKRAQRSSTR
jgi:hypothetical protein